MNYSIGESILSNRRCDWTLQRLNTSPVSTLADDSAGSYCDDSISGESLPDNTSTDDLIVLGIDLRHLSSDIEFPPFRQSEPRVPVIPTDDVYEYTAPISPSNGRLITHVDVLTCISALTNKRKRRHFDYTDKEDYNSEYSDKVNINEHI